MAIELKIRWDGDVAGLAEHRLSVNAFGESLPLLLNALRRIATRIVCAVDENDGPQTGRFANLARLLDIEIVGVEGNSTGINARVSFSDGGGADAAAFADLPSRATLELVESIDRETRRQATNGSVRKYLRSLPNGVNHQVYEVLDGGRVTKRIDVGNVQLAELPPSLPVLKEYEGLIVGVGFETGRTEVRIKTETNNSVTLQTSSESVDRAIEYRHEKIRTLSVHDEKRGRLISLKKASDPKFEFTREAVENHIFKRWDAVLRELAK
jgi:hypothetical protein